MPILVQNVILAKNIAQANITFFWFYADKNLRAIKTNTSRRIFLVATFQFKQSSESHGKLCDSQFFFYIRVSLLHIGHDF